MGHPTTVPPQPEPRMAQNNGSYLHPILESSSNCKSLSCRVATSPCLPALGGHSLPHGFEVCEKFFHTWSAPDRRQQGERDPHWLHASPDKAGTHCLMLNSRGCTSCGNSLASSVRENNRSNSSPRIFPALPGCTGS